MRRIYAIESSDAGQPEDSVRLDHDQRLVVWQPPGDERVAIAQQPLVHGLTRRIPHDQADPAMAQVDQVAHRG